jgi:glutaredoxin-like YruB-family protein
MATKAVTIYSTPTCPWCRKAKDYLTSKGVQYTDFNVGEDRAKLDEMVRLTGQRGVPVIKVNGEVIVGFNQDRIDKAIGS